MKIKDIIKNISIYSALLIMLSAKTTFAYDYSIMNRENEKQMVFLEPKITDESSYEEQARQIIKIDKIRFPRYLKFKNTGQSTYVNEYKNNAGFGLKTNPMGYVYYTPNISNKSLITEPDKSKVLANVGTKYQDYSGDLWWNYRRAVVGIGEGYGVKIGALDGMRNFKPSQQKPNTRWIENQWPAFPATDTSVTSTNTSVPSGSTAEAFGSDILITETLEKAGDFSYNNKHRNPTTRSLTNKHKRIKGEWRYLGANPQGGWVSNPMFPSERLNTVSKSLTPINQNWKVLTEAQKTIYNDKTETGDIKVISERTFDKFIKDLSPKKNGTVITKTQAYNYFAIRTPYGPNVSAVIDSYYEVTSRVTSTIPAEGVIDIEMSSLKIKNDLGEEIYRITQTTDKNGVSQGEEVIGTGDVLKLQPGKEYTIEAKLKNRAKAHSVYNPTVNVLLKSKVNEDVDMISTPSKADAYGVYTLGNMDTGNRPTVYKNIGATKVTTLNNGFFSVAGDRLLMDSKNQKRVPIKNDDNVINEKSSKTIKMKFKIDGAENSTEMESKFGTKNANSVQLILASQINSKHQISDLVFYNGGINKVDTSVDDLYQSNNSLSTDWSVSQDLSLGGKSDYTFKDSKGNEVSGEIKKGEDYTLGVKVINGSKLWDTSIAPKLDYVIKDASTGNTLVAKKTVQASKILKKTAQSATTSSSMTVNIPINIPSTVKAKKVAIEVNLSADHNKNYDDWYDGNNSFKLTLGVADPLDLKIQESMGDQVGDNKPNEIVVFSGETVNLMSHVSSNVDYAVGPVKIKFTKTPGNTIVEKQISSLDKNNTQEIGYAFKAPTVGANEADKLYTVVAEVNPEGPGRIDEVNYNNNKVTFKVRVTGDISNYGCTSIVREQLDAKGRPTGTVSGRPQKLADSQYTSYVPTVTVKRRDIENGSKGDWYDYPIQLRSKQLKVATNEIHKIEEVLFKSKFTTDRYAEKLDRDKISSDGFVDVLKYPKYAKVKAGYGYEIKVKTSYKTNIKEAFDQAISKGMDTKLNSGRTVYQEVMDLINILNNNSGYEINTTKSTMKVSFTPAPNTVTLNAAHEVLCVVMPNGESFTSIDPSKKLIERMARKSTDSNDVYNYDAGVEWNYQFTKRNNGMGDTSRRYYISENTTNSTSRNKYYMRIGTNKLGIGGLINAKSNGVYDVKDIEIIVYGGRTDDLKDTAS